MKRIPLRARDGSVRAHALVDDDDFEHLAQWAWQLHAEGYVQRVQRRAGGRTLILMHRLLMGLPSGQVDHKNGNRLDNQRHNLRVTSHSGNQQNSRPGFVAGSGHRNVYWREARGKYQVVLKVNGRGIHRGYFEYLDDAVAAAATARKELHPYATT